MDAHNYNDYKIIGYDFYKNLPEINTEVMWAIAANVGNFFEGERFTTSQEIKEGKGDYVFTSKNGNTYIKYQLFKDLPEIGEGEECTDLTENVFIPDKYIKSNIDYFVNIIIDHKGNPDKILVIDWRKFMDVENIIIMPDQEHETEDPDEKTVTLGMVRDFMSELPLYVFPVSNCSKYLTRMGKEILNDVITYKRGY